MTANYDPACIANNLAEKEYCLLERFLALEDVRALQQVFNDHRLRDNFKKAGVGTADRFKVLKEVRGDWIKWIDPETAAPATLGFIKIMQGIMEELNQLLFLSMKDFECHFALYPPGTFYEKHLDQFRGSNQRKLSFAFYLNENWEPGHGGELRLHLPEGPIDIAPIAGNLAIFRSDTVVHEVLTTTVNRYSITGWMRDRPVDFPIV